MKRAYAAGTAALRFTLEELVARLVAIVPPAGANQIVYRGVLAGVPPPGNAALRAEIVPKVEQVPGPSGKELGPLTRKAKGPGRRLRATWAELIWRVFEVRSWHCTSGARSLRREDGAAPCDGRRPDDEEGAGRADTRRRATLSAPRVCAMAGWRKRTRDR